jgi:hypothetical protein
MVVNKERNIKRFKRILKELGIYNLYIRERRKQYPDVKVFSVAGRYSSLSSIIDYSFTWADTKNPDLWPELTYAIDREFSQSIDYFSNLGNGALDKLKKHLENNKSLLL